MKKLIHVADIKNPPADVFAAITTQGGLSSWWSKSVVAEPKLESVVDFTFSGGFNPDTQITALDASRLLRWTCIGGTSRGGTTDSSSAFGKRGVSSCSCRSIRGSWMTYSTGSLCCVGAELIHGEILDSS